MLKISVLNFQRGSELSWAGRLNGSISKQNWRARGIWSKFCGFLSSSAEDAENLSSQFIPNHHVGELSWAGSAVSTTHGSISIFKTKVETIEEWIQRFKIPSNSKMWIQKSECKFKWVLGDFDYVLVLRKTSLRFWNIQIANQKLTGARSSTSFILINAKSRSMFQLSLFSTEFEFWRDRISKKYFRILINRIFQEFSIQFDEEIFVVTLQFHDFSESSFFSSF